MVKRDTRIDIYIENSNEFAKPILTYLRKLVHHGCPDVIETIKWGFPNFEYKGRMCYMAAFKGHCSFGFWKAPLIKNLDSNKKIVEGGMGNIGKIKSMEDLPDTNLFLFYIHEAARLNDENIKLPRQKKTITKDQPMESADFLRSLEKNELAKSNYEDFTLAQKRDYIEWVCEAKTKKTKVSRISTAIKWISEGKSHNWKYMAK